MALWAATLGFFWILKKFVGQVHLLDPGALLGGYLFVAVSGLLFVALGVLASALSRNHAVAGILCFVLLFAFIGGAYYLPGAAWLNRDTLQPLKAMVDYAQVFRHCDDFTRGTVDARQIFFYASGTVLALIFSILSVEARQLHS
jgi:ABC-2 type transport system permease protein